VENNGMARRAALRDSRVSMANINGRAGYERHLSRMDQKRMKGGR